MSRKRKPKYYALDAKECGVGGVVLRKPRERKQAKRAKSFAGYMDVFFPTITGLWPATIMYGDLETFASTPDAARMKYMDRRPKSDKWTSYQRAGHRIRKVKIIDMGDA